MRLPHADSFRFIAQESGPLRELKSVSELSGKSGFLFAPYNIDDAHPLLLLRADVDAMYNVADLPLGVSQGVGVADAMTDDYRNNFDSYVDELVQGNVAKLVLSRTLDIELGEFDAVELFARACRRYPRVVIYLFVAEGWGAWLGCTPELLISSDGSVGRTVALAGTQPVPTELSGEETFKMELWDEKNLHEQNIVEKYIDSVLSGYTDDCRKDGPFTVRAGDLLHIKTSFEFSMKGDASLAALVDALHPTPAVCGLPKETARRIIAKHESRQRSYYSGFVGLWQMDGCTELYVNLRCMHGEAGRVRLYAGGGILPTSVMEQEWRETQEKMKTILNIL
ncbi:MAG: isochorismate synthase [Bacteroidaceae bacterium]|nr:isochorismate synthase [Bacteroidaceae bacterium]